jgi:hypothetical protein
MRTLTLEADRKEKTFNREAATSKDRGQTNVKAKTLNRGARGEREGKH